MPKYEVRMPFAGVAVVEVDAKSEEEAIDAVLDTAARMNILKDKGNPRVSDFDIEEWGFLEAITEGNVCYAPVNDVEINEIEKEG